MLFCQGMSCRTRRLCIPYPATIDIFYQPAVVCEHARSSFSQVYYQIAWDFFCLLFAVLDLTNPRNE